MKYLTLAAGVLSISSVAFAKVEKSEFNGKGLKTLRVTNASGETKVSVSNENTAYVEVDKLKFPNECSLLMTRTGDTLIVEMLHKPKDTLVNNTCKANFDIKIPESVAVIVNNGLGNIEVYNTKGDVNVVTGSGSIKFDGKSSSFNAKSGSGVIEVEGLTADANVETGSGAIDVEYDDIASKGNLVVKSGSGDITMKFPSKMQIDTDLKSNSGLVHNDLGNTSGSLFKVNGQTGSGHFYIKKS
ncbi:DUF4097 domain-containing protein [Dolichospermum sp. ST_sed1]|nr:DUF4097 domain-containing protein [Dolichospermum sp. ST_sed1]